MSEASQKDIERIARPGDILAGKYLVERLLGVGGMGAVVAATHTQLDQRVAIKLLLPSMLANREVVERFQREARASAKIKSEHVVRVSDVGMLDSGVPFIVMEFLEGGDLGELLARRGPLPVELAVDYVLEAAEALAEAHSIGIVHRDLKPANLFLANLPDDTQIVKVLDFGISKQISADALQSSPSLTKTTDVFGSPTYMSPEQLKASRDVDVRADIWALGVILFELLTGQPPFGGGTVAEIFGAILHKPAPRIRESRKDVPAEVERILLRCLQKEASDRFQNVAELADALAPFGSDGARESTARVARVLRSSGGHPRAGAAGRASLPGVPDPRQSSPDRSSPGLHVSPAAVQANTGLGSEKSGSGVGDPAGGPSAGSSTATSWGHVRPTARSSSSRILLAAGAAVVAAALGAFFVLKLVAPAGSGTSSAQSASPSAEPLPTSTTPVASTIVSPAPTSSVTTDPTPAVTPATATPAGSPSPKLTGKTPGSAAPTATAAPTPPTAPPATATEPPKPPATGGDDDFGGRR